jgi:hypothetical protein
VAEWRSTLLFLFAAQIANRDAEWGIRLLGRLLENQNRASVKANPLSAAFVAEALEFCLTKSYGVPEKLKGGFLRLAIDAIEDEVELRPRQAIGLCLGRLGDPRILSLRDPSAYIEVSAGSYPLGDDRKRQVKIEAFMIGRYPATNSQYQEFIKDGGYAEKRWWSDAGWAWRRNPGSRFDGREEEVTEPALWRSRRWNGPNQPVVGVSFWEAEACSAWAGGRLPTQDEWEAAAGAMHGHDYPWGNGWRDGICNIKEADLGTTSPVGLFPGSRQREHGIEDLAGNVWEWCASLYDRKKNPSAMRGGSWDSKSPDVARSGYGGMTLGSGSRVSDAGFRAVFLSPIAGN